ncbi:hypothetical protein B0H10DRAFT_1040920 [Mycena sp. CBHHK59/15]|nr:hypothetical protein B0H10DRAFT_1040920 [Mycena sp. CBHHK59/15]
MLHRKRWPLRILLCSLLPCVPISFSLAPRTGSPCPCELSFGASPPFAQILILIGITSDGRSRCSRLRWSRIPRSTTTRNLLSPKCNRPPHQLHMVTPSDRLTRYIPALG